MNRLEWLEYLERVRPDLSDGSRRAYSFQFDKILEENMKKAKTPLELLIRLTNKAVRDKSLEFITIKDSAKQGQNQRLAAVMTLLKANKESVDEKKYNNLLSLLQSVGVSIREEISTDNGENKKNEKEEEAFKTTWSSLEEFASAFHSLTSTAARDYIILNLLLNNYIINQGIKFNVLLRTIEYSSLRLWNKKGKPPADKQNYLWVPKNQLYIQNSKTTGGITAKGLQAVLKTYPVLDSLMDKIKIYIKTHKLKHLNALFYADNDKDKSLTTNYFGRIFNELLSPLSDNMTIGMVRKIYENRPKEDNLTANQMKEQNKMVDHTMSVAATFYKKL